MRFYFNPRSREGSDEKRIDNVGKAFQFQSTLPRGERHLIPRMQSCITLFQSTLPRGERLVSLVVLPVAHDFNPRSREGSDIVDMQEYKYINNFNPRSREGSDNIISASKLLWRISIHAPARGATNNTVRRWDKCRISIHAPARGATWRTKT